MPIHSMIDFHGKYFEIRYGLRPCEKNGQNNQWFFNQLKKKINRLKIFFNRLKRFFNRTMRIFLPNVLRYQIPRIQLPDFGNTFLAECA